MKKRLIITILVLLILSGGYYYAESTNTVTADNVVEVNEVPEATKIEKKAHELAVLLLGKKTKALKDEVLAQLLADESNVPFSDTDVFYTHDPSQANYDKCRAIGGRRNINCDSWGPLQFKITTVQHYYKTLYSEDISQKEALFIALDEEKATKLAQDIIFEVEGGIYEWSASSKHVEYYNAVIPFIRDLEK